MADVIKYDELNTLATFDGVVVGRDDRLGKSLITQQQILDAIAAGDALDETEAARDEAVAAAGVAAGHVAAAEAAADLAHEHELAAQEWAEAAAAAAGSSGGSEYFYATRAQLISAVSGGMVPTVGAIYVAGGLAYRGKALDTEVIPGMPGFIPAGRITAEHFGAASYEYKTTAIDSTDALQAAIDWCQASETTDFAGRQVLHLDGAWYGHNGLTISKPITIKGAGVTTTTLKALSVGSTVTIAPTSLDNYESASAINAWVQLHDLSIIGPGRNAGGSENGITLSRAATNSCRGTVYLTNIRAQGSGGYGIGGDNFHGLVVMDKVHARLNKLGGFALDACNDWHFVECESGTNDGYGYNVTSCSQIVMLNCNTYANGSIGVRSVNSKVQYISGMIDRNYQGGLALTQTDIGRSFLLSGTTMGLNSRATLNTYHDITISAGSQDNVRLVNVSFDQAGDSATGSVDKNIYFEAVANTRVDTWGCSFGGAKEITDTDTNKPAFVSIDGQNPCQRHSGFAVVYNANGNIVQAKTELDLGEPPIGARYEFVPAARNSGAATLQIDSGSAYPIRTVNGLPLPGDYLRPSQKVRVTFDGAYWLAEPAAPMFAGYLTPEQFGAKGDGTTNDTAAMQAWLNAIPRNGGGVMNGGSIYCVTNLSLPTFSTLGTGIVDVPEIRSTGGLATIKRIAGGDTDYMIATDRWVTGAANSTFGGSPWRFTGIRFDGAGVCDYPVVHKNYATEFYGCDFRGGLVDDCLFTRQNQDGSLGTTSYLSDCKWVGCRFTSTGSNSGLKSQSAAGSDTDGPTDALVLGCSFNSLDTADYCMDLSNTGGWLISNNHTYSSVVTDMRIRRLVKMGGSTGNLFEHGVMIDSAGGTSVHAVFGGGNSHWSDLVVNFRDDDTAETLIIQGDRFLAAPLYADPGTPDARLVTNTDHTNKVAIARDCYFLNSTPAEQLGTGGIIRIQDATRSMEFSGGLTARSAVNPTDMSIFRSSSSAANAPIFNFYRRRGTLTTPEDVDQFDYLMRLPAYGYGGGGDRAAAEDRVIAMEATPGATAMGARRDFLLSPIGSITPTVLATYSWATGLTMGDGSSTVIDADRGIVLRGYTAAQLADAAHAVNTQNKRIGKKVIDTTNDREMRAKGTAATSTWVDSNGANTITPA